MALLIKCKQCGQVRVAMNPQTSSIEAIGASIRQAAQQGSTVELAEGSHEVRCMCAEPLSESSTQRSLQARQWNTRQLIFITTLTAIALVLLRNPLMMAWQARAWTAFLVPWKFFGWFFFGMDLPSKGDIGKNPISILLFSVGMISSVLTAFFMLGLGFQLIAKGWNWAKKK